MDFVRENPAFALCGLNCCLCPRFNTDSASRCPGCGGPGFSRVHPTCAVATCNRKRDGAEFCFRCREYPCAKYREQGDRDSFVSYRRVRQNLEDAKVDLARYEIDLAKRYAALRLLLEGYDDGRRKGLYCLVANDAPLDELQALIARVESLPGDMDTKERAKRVKSDIAALEARLGFQFKLRK